MDADNKVIKVLDKGFVRLDSYMASDDDVVRAARVSFGATEAEYTNSRGLIRTLMREQHTSPFEMCEFRFHVKAPLFVVAQWVRHRTWSYSFQSYRYTQAPDEFYEPAEWRMQSTDNKQGSGGAAPKELQKTIDYNMGVVIDDAYQTYSQATKSGVAREQARMVLPQSLYTQFYAKVDLHNLLHFLQLRLDTHAQWEIQQYAQAMAEFVSGICPLVYEAFKDYRLFSTKFSQQEMMYMGELLRPIDYPVEYDDTSGLTKREWAEFIRKLSMHGLGGANEEAEH